MGLFETLFTQYGAWSWWVLGFVLLAIEVFHPFSISIWFGLAALVIGVLAMVFDWSWQTLFVLWAVVSIAMLVVGRRFLRRGVVHSDDPLLNDRAGRLVGRVFTLVEPIGENGGRLTIDDTVWRVRGPLTEAGHKVRIAGVDGTVLVVETAG
jgi:hypothetical protein